MGIPMTAGRRLGTVPAAAVTSAIDKYRSGGDGEIGAAHAVVGLSAERVAAHQMPGRSRFRVAR